MNERIVVELPATGSIPQALLIHCIADGARHGVGSSRRSALRQRLFPGVAERLLRSERNFDVVIASKGTIP